MRREGRLHGTNVRVNKKEVDYLQKASAKPTNHSKISARCPGNKVRCQGCSKGTPVKKSIRKVKTASKAWDLDITRNHKMHEWRLSENNRWGNFSRNGDDDEESAGDDDDQQPRTGRAGARAVWKASDDSDAEEEDEPARSPEMVCPIEFLLQMRSNSKRAAAARLKDGHRLESRPSIAESLVMTHSVLIDDSEDDGWCDLDFSEDDDEADIVEVEDWVLVMDLD